MRQFINRVFLSIVSVAFAWVLLLLYIMTGLGAVAYGGPKAVRDVWRDLQAYAEDFYGEISEQWDNG